MTVRYTDTELAADSEPELRTFVERSLLLPKSRVRETLDGLAMKFESASERIISFVMGAVPEGSELWECVGQFGGRNR